MSTQDVRLAAAMAAGQIHHGSKKTNAPIDGVGGRGGHKHQLSITEVCRLALLSARSDEEGTAGDDWLGNDSETQARAHPHKKHSASSQMINDKMKLDAHSRGDGSARANLCFDRPARARTQERFLCGCLSFTFTLSLCVRACVRV